MDPKVPKYALTFLRWFCREDYLEEIEGDLMELFEQRHESEPVKAKWAFTLQVLAHLRPDFIKAFGIFPLIHFGMLKHNFLISYRGFLRNKSSFLINIVGLSTGLACFLLVYMWVHDEMTVDTFHKKDEQLYLLMSHHIFPDKIGTGDRSSLLLAEALKDEMPEVEAATLIIDYYDPEGFVSNEEHALEARRILANEQFFDVFSYKLIEGDPKQVLANKQNIAISQELAEKLFGTSQVIGKFVEWRNPDGERKFQITGVFDSPPTNASRQFDAVLHYDLLVDEDPPAAQWNSSSAENYLVLAEGTDIPRFNEKIENYLLSKDSDTEKLSLFVKQFSQHYLHGRYENGVLVGGRIEYVRYFSLLALAILLIACINFMNLSTAQASKKMKEIGVKKAMGANRKALIGQFLTESILMVMISLLFAIGLAYNLLPHFNELSGKAIEFRPGINMMLSVLGIGLLTGLLAGSYPAFVLSGFKPVIVLKGKRDTAASEHWIRKSLVVFQFAMAILFIVGVWVVDQQIEYTQNKDMGYSRDNVISFDRPRHNDDLNTFLTELRRVPGVEHASNMEGNFLLGWDAQSGFSWSDQDSDKDWLFESPQVGFDMIETLGLKLLDGRTFSEEHNDDRHRIIINESARKMMQLDHPIGMRISKNVSQAMEHREIIGVVDDFHYSSLHHAVKPLIFRLRHHGRNIMVKMEPGTEQATLQRIEAVFESFHSGYPFTFTFLDDENQQLYESETRIAILSKYIAGLAIIISCLGLLGLTVFMAEQRTKEIGIRKILGASVMGIVGLLSRDITQTIGIAVVLALPISYGLSGNWLQNFAYKIDLDWWIFAGTAGLILLIAWVTVGIQSLRAAWANPVESLRSE